MPRKLAPPPAARHSTKAQEIARIWAVDGSMQVVMEADLWQDPATWGIMLSDLAGHVANIYAKQGHDRERTLARVWAGLDAERSHPTDEPKEIDS